MTLTIHHLETSQSERIVWLCEELGLDYQIERYERDPETRLAPEAYKALHAMGVAPVITDGDLVLGESGAICEYLDRRRGGSRLSPSPDDPDFADHVFWFHWSNATFMAAQVAQLAIRLACEGAARPTFIADRLTLCWDMIERRLGEATFFGGDRLTTADIMMVYCLTTARMFRGTSIEDRPNIQTYLARIGSRPAYRRALARAEPGWEPWLT